MTRWLVQQSETNKSRGTFLLGDRAFECALGREGCSMAEDKREGDGKTPLGSFVIRYAYYRPDRLERPETRLDLMELNPSMGWCDDSNHMRYNRPVSKPIDVSHEDLWRDDHVYDLIIVIGHNDDPVVGGMGSAIFIHIAREGYIPTRGCVALEKADLLETLSLMKSGDVIEIAGKV